MPKEHVFMICPMYVFLVSPSQLGQQFGDATPPFDKLLVIITQA
jgi:hypothetical protein